jgi:hypothetical protein
MVEGTDPHLTEIRLVRPNAQGCEDCLRIGGVWCICACV